MHVLLVAIARTPNRPALDGLDLDRLVRLLPFPEGTLDRWQSPAGDVAVLRWGAHDAGAGLLRDPTAWDADDRGLRTAIGWLIEPGAPWRTSSELLASREADDEAGVEGAYLGLVCDGRGEGRVLRPRVGTVPLYASAGPKAWFLSNRASVAAAAAQGTTALGADWGFHATMIGVGWALGTRTAFAGTEAVLAGSDVRFAPGQLTIAPPRQDPWWDDAAAAALAADPKGAWDRMFEWLMAFYDGLTAVIPPGGARFNLSGGTDSRLLLGLMKAAGWFDRLQTIRSTGAPYLPDLVVARRIARHYGLATAGGEVTIPDDRSGEQLAQHLFFSDAGISPWDMSWKSDRVISGAAFFGHEVATKESGKQPEPGVFGAWARKYYHGFDTLKVLRPEATAGIAAAFDAWLEGASAQTRPENLATRLRMESRGERWAAVIGAFDATRTLPINPLMADFVTRHQYSAGPEVRGSWQFHYEMLMRADRWLVEGMPLAGKSWPTSLNATLDAAGVRPPPPLLDVPGTPPTLRTSDLAFERHRDRLFEWLLSERNHALFESVDPAALEELRSRPIEGRQRMAFWNMVQAKLAADTTDWSALAPWRSAPPESLGRIGLPLHDKGEVTAINVQELERLRAHEKLASSYGKVIAALRDAELDRPAPPPPDKK